MLIRRFVGVSVLVALSACQGECSCGSSNDDGGGGGAGGSTTNTSATTTTSPSGSTSSAGGAGQGGDGQGGTGQGGAGQGGTSQGGAGQGGTSQGGAGQGGTSDGGGGSSTGGAGPGGGGQGGAEPAVAQCESAGDCQLVDDCCACDAIPATEDPEQCAMECVISSCSAFGLPPESEVSCQAGQCVAGFTCDWSLVTCDAVQPDCPEGMTASVVDGCFGSCVPAAECVSVGSCDQCDGGLSCVLQTAFVTVTHCVEPGSCALNDCECLGPAVCDRDQDVCSATDDGVVCSCITC